MEKNKHSGIRFMVLSVIKALIPIGILYRLRYFKQLTSSKSLATPTRKRIYYLDAPDYANLGDQAIALAIRKFSEREFSEYEFIEILQAEVAGYVRWLKKHIQPDDIVFLTGGGNMGNKYRMYEATRRFLINSLPNNRVFIFPQSVDFSNDIFGRASMKAASAIYYRPKVTLFIREENSLNKVKDSIPNAILVPDIVLSLQFNDLNKKTSNRDGVGLCFRNDMEGVLTHQDREQVKNFTESLSGNNITELSTISAVKRITEENREDVLSELLSRFSSCKLIITDRLHAMIFAVITNTPCVVFDNKNHKISGVYKFVKDKCAVVLINSPKQLSVAVEKVQMKTCDFDRQELYGLITKLVKKD